MINNDKIKKAIIDTVKPEIKRKLSNKTGVVVKTYYEVKGEGADNLNRNCVDVEVEHPVTGNVETLETVPITGNSLMGGVEGARLKKGDNVVVSFQDGRSTYPRVVAKAYKNPATRNKELRIIKGTFVSGGRDAV